MNFIELTMMNGEKQIVNTDKIRFVYSDDKGVQIMIGMRFYCYRESYSRLKEMLLPFEINLGGDNGVPNCAKGED